MNNVMQCERCGGQLLPVENDSRFWKCASCATLVPAKTVGSEKTTQLLNIANATRCALKFSDAIKLYYQIIEEDQYCSEAYWGLVLSKLGIEYVKDTDGNYIPTCHRTSFQSILKDKDYIKALETATNDDIKKDYQEKAEIIEEIRLKLLDLAKKDKPYDIFICFKAREEIDGKKFATKDSELAQRIYHHFDKLGYNVFFSNISLEKHIGGNYEPHIFSALNSSSCMMLICFNPEFIESTWVKNEWTRYIELIDKGEKKENSLIPIVKGMDASQLPYDLQQIEALNIDDNIKWLETLEEVVEKLVIKNKKSSLVRHLVKKQDFKKGEKEFNQVTKTTRKFELKGQVTVEPSIELKLSIGYKFLSRGDFKHAKKQFEGIIKENPNIHNAYWGLALTKLKCSDEANLNNICDLDNYNDIENAITNSTSEELANSYLNKFKNAVYAHRETAPIDKLINAINKFMEWEKVDEGNFQKSFIHKFFDLPFKRTSSDLFDTLKKYVPEAEVDYYISYLDKYADFCAPNNISLAIKYYDEILNIEKDNTVVLWKKYKLQNPNFKLNKTKEKELNKILEYGFSNDLIIKELQKVAIEKIKTNLIQSIKIFELAISWISEEQNKVFLDSLYNYASNLNANNYHHRALKYYNEMISVNDKDSRGYIGRLMCKHKCGNINHLIYKIKKPLMDIANFNNALNCGDEHQELYIELASKQDDVFKNKRTLNKKALKIIIKMTFATVFTLIPIGYCWYNVSLSDTKSILIACGLILLTLILSRKLIVKRGTKKLKGLIGISRLFKFYGFILRLIILLAIGYYVYIEYSNSLSESVMYSYQYDEVIITGYRKNSKDIVIPSTIRGKKVVDIKEDAFKGATADIEIKSNHLYLEIGDYDFRGYMGETIVLPDNIQAIGNYAFAGCENLKFINIPSSVETIGDSAFEGCKSLVKVTIPNNITEINKNTFSNCFSLREINFPNNLQTIKEYAFSHCLSINNVEIPSNVNEIKEHAFFNCISLTYIYIPLSVNQIERFAFRACDNITIYCESIDLPTNWESDWNIKVANEYLPVVWNS